MAEKAGFEPARAFTPSGFRNRPLQPLGYFSKEKALMRFFIIIACNKVLHNEEVHPQNNGFEVDLR